MISETIKQKMIKWGWINSQSQPLYLRFDDITGKHYFSIFPPGTAQRKKY